MNTALDSSMMDFYKQWNPMALDAMRFLTNRELTSMAVAEDNTVIRTFKCRLLPSKKQHAALAEILESQRILYNAALKHRIGAWRKARESISYLMQQRELTELRLNKEFATVPARMQRWTLRKLDDAYKGFFRRVKNGDKAGFPRFKCKGRWRSFGFCEWEGIRHKGKRFRFKGMPGGLRIHIHRPLPEGKPLCCAFFRDVNGWYVCLQYRIPITTLLKTGREVGMDVGVRELCVLSNSEIIPNPRKGRRAEKEQRRLNRALDRCKRGTKRRVKIKRRLQRFYMRVRSGRSTYLHQVSAKLVRENDKIYIEDLNVQGLARGILAKSVHDASWSMLRQFLTYKAEGAGRELVAVDPRQTSQICPECGQVAKKKLSQRTHKCDCGCILDRDHAAAKVILARGRSGSRVRQRKAVAYA